MADRVPNQLYYPGCVVALSIRFDGAFKIGRGPRPVIVTGADGIDSGKWLPDPQNGTPLIRKGGSLAPDGLSHVTGRVPKQANVELPGYRQAGTFDLTLDFRDLAIDPRLVRACGVEIHLGSVADRDFAAGMTGIRADGTRRSQLVPTADNLALWGTADQWSVDHGKDGSMVKLKGRDMRGLLLDSPVLPALLRKVALHHPIDAVVNAILQMHPYKALFAGCVVVQPGEWPGGKLPSPGDRQNRTRINLDADGQGNGRSMPAGDPGQLNFWDVITRYCFLVGAIPTFVGKQLRIRPSRSLFQLREKAGFDPAVPTPFAGGQVRDVGGSEFPLQIRRLVYGRDIEQLSFERKFNGFTPRIIRCESIDTGGKQRGMGKYLSAEWPKQVHQRAPVLGEAGGDAGTFATAGAGHSGGTSTEAGASGQAADGSITEKLTLKIPCPGVKDKATLLRIAQDLFEELGRGEMGGSCSTRNLASFGAGNQDPDLLRLRPGDAIEFKVDSASLSSRSPAISEITNQARMGDDELIGELALRLGDENLARVIVATARSSVATLHDFFRVATVKFDWDAAKGIGISFDYQNYVESRHAVTPITLPGKKKPPVRRRS